MERVVVTGIGVASPLGCRIADFWDALCTGSSGTKFLGEVFPKLSAKVGAPVRDYDEAEFFTRKEARRMSRSSQFAIVAAERAIEDSGLKDADIDPAEVGVIIGSCIGGFSASSQAFLDFYSKGRVLPLTIPIAMNVSPSANVSIRHGYQGPMMAMDAACASATHAIGYAYFLIKYGMVKTVITGGADSPFSPAVVSAWEATRAVSPRRDIPETACRPFSADRDGLVLGEGAGIFVLEAESQAIGRGAQLLAEIKGYGASSDSYHLTQPTLEGPVMAMQRSLEDAGLEESDIDYINAHGTGTLWNDSNETSAIKEAFGEYAYQIPVVSNKSALGHSIGASGALELASCILSLRDQILPPTINYQAPDPECDLNYVTDGSISWKTVNILSNSFAFGGSNACLVVGKNHELK